MQPVIIHIPQAFDRIPAVAGLMKSHPGAKVFPAHLCPWEPKESGCVRGSSVSHLEAALSVLTKDTPALILEDDAVIRPEAWASFDISQVPVDAGIVLLGSDTENTLPPDDHGYREVLPPNWGAHAVLYMPSLLNTRFFFDAFRILSSSKIGGNGGLCYESVIHMALKPTGFRLVRPPSMTHTTAIVTSSRTGTELLPCEKNLDLLSDKIEYIES